MRNMLGQLYGRGTAWLKPSPVDGDSSDPSPKGVVEETSSRRYAVGIDLGTTLSASGYLSETGQTTMVRNSDGEILTPAVVLF